MVRTYVCTCVLIFLEKDRCKECQGEKVVRERKILEVGLYVHVYYYLEYSQSEYSSLIGERLVSISRRTQVRQ